MTSDLFSQRTSPGKKDKEKSKTEKVDETCASSEDEGKGKENLPKSNAKELFTDDIKEDDKKQTTTTTTTQHKKSLSSSSDDGDGGVFQRMKDSKSVRVLYPSSDDKEEKKEKDKEKDDDDTGHYSHSNSGKMQKPKRNSSRPLSKGSFDFTLPLTNSPILSMSMGSPNSSRNKHIKTAKANAQGNLSLNLSDTGDKKNTPRRNVCNNNSGPFLIYPLGYGLGWVSYSLFR